MAMLSTVGHTTTMISAFKSTSNTINDHHHDHYNNNNSHNGNDDEGRGVSTTVYYTIAIVLTITLIVGVFFNVVAIFVFVKNKQLRTPTNSFVVALCVCDLLMCVLGIPIPAVLAWQQATMHSHALCVFDGFIVYFLGLSSMYLLAAISVDRYVVIVRPVASWVVTQRQALLSVSLCFGLGLFWTVMPLLGWNRFVPEGIGVACSISWRSLEPAGTSYIFTMFVFCLLLPLCVMAVCYVKIYLVIRNVNRHSMWAPDSQIGQNNYRVERKMLRTIVSMLCVFLVSWTPYAVVSLAQTFSGRAIVDPVTETIPALIAKMSAIWDPIVYIATNTQFRQAFFGVVPCCQRLLGVCSGDSQSDTSNTAMDESGIVLEDSQRSNGCRQDLELTRSAKHNRLSGSETTETL